MALKFLEKSHQYRMTEHPGPATAPKGANPYKRVTGATTLLNGGVPKPLLMPWYARMVAEYVRDNREDVERLWASDGQTFEGVTIDMVRSLARVPEQIRDAAAERGTEVHHYAEKILNGEQVEVPEAIASFVEGYLDLIDAWDIRPILTETSCGNRANWHSGRFDGIAEIGALGGIRVLFDVKTSKYVHAETALQTAGYAKSEFWVSDEDPDTEHPMPELQGTMVAHVTEHGTHLYWLAQTPEEIDRHYELFLGAAFTHKTAKEREAIIGEPLELPTHEMSAAA